MDLNTARFNMVQQQVRTWDVLDSKILHWMSAIPREAFVLNEFRHLAFSDTEIPIGYRQVSLAPKVIGRLLQAISLKLHETVLELGTGTGYITLLLSHLAKDVISLEIIPELLEKAKALLESFQKTNIVLESRDGSLGFQEQAPYDAIVLTGSLPYLPEAFFKQLKLQGRLFVVIGEPPIMSAILVTRMGEKQFKKEVLFETLIPALTHNLPRKVFQF